MDHCSESPAILNMIVLYVSLLISKSSEKWMVLSKANIGGNQCHEKENVTFLQHLIDSRIK